MIIPSFSSISVPYSLLSVISLDRLLCGSQCVPSYLSLCTTSLLPRFVCFDWPNLSFPKLLFANNPCTDAAHSFKHHVTVTSYGIPPLTVSQSGNNAGNLSYNKIDTIYCGFKNSIGLRRS